MRRAFSLALGLLLSLGLAAQASAQSRAITLIPAYTLAGSATRVGDVARLAMGTKALTVQAAFVRAAGGTSAKVYVQTSLDAGATWVDIACLAFTTTTATKVSGVRLDTALTAAYAPTDGTLADDTIKDGLLGDRIRVKLVVVGTYTGASSVTVTAVAN